MTDVLSKDIYETVSYLENCSEEDIYYISPVFDDISERLQSTKFIECIEQLAVKYPDSDLEVDIMYAKKALK